MAILLPSNLSTVVQDMIDPEKQVQSAGVDLTVNSIQRFTGESFLALDNANRVLPPNTDVELTNGYFYLSPGGYQLRYNETIHVPNDAAAVTLPRSSLMRAGATIHSALWDPGYIGKGMGLLTVFHPIKVEKNARIAQIVFFELSDTASTTYNGAYQGEGVDTTNSAD